MFEVAFEHRVDESVKFWQYSTSESDLGGTVCEKDARTDLWGSEEVTNRSTWNVSEWSQLSKFYPKIGR
jgi:hypothetical protein